MITLTINGKKIELTINPPFAKHEEVQNDLDMHGDFESVEKAIEFLKADIPDIANILNPTPKEDKPVENTTTKTSAIKVIFPQKLGYMRISSEFLESTGLKSDKDLIRKDKEGKVIEYDITFFDLARKCSSKVAAVIETKLNERITYVLTVMAKPAPEPEQQPSLTSKVFKPKDGGKKQAESFIINVLKEGKKMKWDLPIHEKAQLLADWLGKSVTEASAENIELHLDSGVMFVHIPKPVYNQDRSKWGNVLTYCRDACRRNSRLEYLTPRDGRLPIQVRAMKRDEQI